mmetsp:Transcript_52259/g.156840  ORF Transcript_52259/g.156840 Transcript_52259/m.156840 type:complete len:458 (-) Transcript_52259:772-2145(-)
MLRKYFALLLLATIYIFYLFPLSLAIDLADPQRMFGIFPGYNEFIKTNPGTQRLLAGLVPALLFTTFFALCPVMFKAISNFGSNATSVNYAERSALQYYWWFMVFTAFSGSSIMKVALEAIQQRQLQVNWTQALVEIAGAIPSTVAGTWINWIIVRTTMTLPLQYMLQVNSFIFQCVGWRCCRRCVMGGGPGGPIPYRIYIDAGTVFMCIVALAPASPLVAPCGMVYFLYCAPLWRRNCIFMYRPKFDSGGMRWPFLVDMLISSMIVGQILLTAMMALKKAIGPAVMSALPIVPVLVFRSMSKHRYLKAYMDAGLLQTSLLDGWDNSCPTSMEKREEFRQFLIDAHKAAYIPICIAGGATSVLTAEPAVVIPHDNDAASSAYERAMQQQMQEGRHPGVPPPPEEGERAPLLPSTPIASRASAQFGASLRRLPSTTRSSYTEDTGGRFTFISDHRQAV